MWPPRWLARQVIFANRDVLSRCWRRWKETKHGILKVNLKLEVAFMNEKIPTFFQRRPIYICCLTETSDGRLVDFRRIRLVPETVWWGQVLTKFPVQPNSKIAWRLHLPLNWRPQISTSCVMLCVMISVSLCAFFVRCILIATSWDGQESRNKAGYPSKYLPVPSDSMLGQYCEDGGQVR